MPIYRRNGYVVFGNTEPIGVRQSRYEHTICLVRGFLAHVTSRKIRSRSPEARFEPFQSLGYKLGSKPSISPVAIPSTSIRSVGRPSSMQSHTMRPAYSLGSLDDCNIYHFDIDAAEASFTMSAPDPRPVHSDGLQTGTALPEGQGRRHQSPRSILKSTTACTSRKTVTFEASASECRDNREKDFPKRTTLVRPKESVRFEGSAPVPKDDKKEDLHCPQCGVFQINGYILAKHLRKHSLKASKKPCWRKVLSQLFSCVLGDLSTPGPRSNKLVDQLLLQRKGFKNDGNSCFLSAALQVLLTSKFIQNHLDEHRKTCKQTTAKCLPCSVHEDGINIHRVSSTPSNTLRHLNRIVPDRKGKSQMDSLYALDNIGQELVNAGLPEPAGKIEIKTKCSNCTKETIQVVLFNCIQVSLDKSIEDGVKHFFSKRLENMFPTEQCRFCEKNCPATRQFRVVSFPGLLIVELKRYEWQRDRLKYVKNCAAVKLSPSLEPSEVIPERLILVGAVLHKGSTPFSGHYTATLLSGDSNLIFDDHKVTYVASTSKELSKNSCYVVYELLKEAVRRGVSSRYHPSD